MIPNLIGATVALKSHPFSTVIKHSNLLLGGNITNLSPLMIIVEQLKGKEKFDETYGDKVASKFQVRCIWYSSKSAKIESAWFPAHQLMLVNINEEEINILKDSHNQGDYRGYSYDLDMVYTTKTETNFKVPEFKIGQSVCLKTVEIELGKRKSSYEYNTYGTDNKQKIAAALNFVSPVFQIVGFVRTDIQDPLINQKTGERVRWTSSKLAKCKFYNEHLDKFSEIEIPVEALEHKANAEIHVAQIIEAGIQKNRIFQFGEMPSADEVSSASVLPELIEFSSLINVQGRCVATGWNFSLGKKEGGRSLSKCVAKYCYEILPQPALPKFSEEPDKEGVLNLIIDPLQSQVLDEMRVAQLDYGFEGLYILEYVAADEKGLKRKIIRNPEIISQVSTGASGSTEVIRYLKAECLKNNFNPRYFRAESIRSFRMLKKKSIDELAS